MKDDDSLILESLYIKVNEYYHDDGGNASNPYTVTIEDQAMVVINGDEYYGIGDVEVSWESTPEQKQTYTDPGIPASVEILDFDFDENFRIVKVDEVSGNEIPITPEMVGEHVYIRLLRALKAEAEAYASNKTEQYVQSV